MEKDEDDELGIWEQQQIKKGASMPASQQEPKYGPDAPPEFGQPVVGGTFQPTHVYPGANMYAGQGNAF